jgi:hypothetical protein
MKVTAFKLARKASFHKKDKLSYNILNGISDEKVA